MKRVVLLGGSGQLGKAVIEIVPEDFQLVSPPSEELDLSNASQIQQFLEKHNPEAVINCAAYTAVDAAEENSEQAFAINAQGIGNLARITPDKTKLIHISTDFVFSMQSPVPYTSADETAPISVYGRSKLEGEKLLMANHPENSVIVRTSWLYSAVGKNFVLTMLELMETRSSLNVVNDQLGSPTSVYSLAEIIWKFALKEDASGIFHWSDRGIISWYDFAVEIYEQARAMGLLKQDVIIRPIPSEEYPTPARRPEYSALDSTETENILGMKTSPWQEELAKVLTRIKETRA